MQKQNILELLSLAVFFICYKVFDLQVATAVLILCTFFNIAFLYYKKQTPSKLMIFSALVLLIFGGLSFIKQDVQFIKMKPTIIYLSFALCLIVGMFLRKYFITQIFGKIFALTHKDEFLLTLQWVIVFLIFAFLNEIIWRSCSESTWVSLKVFAFPALTIIVLAGQIYFFRKKLKR